MDGVVLHQSVNDVVAVGARHCEQRGCAECHAAELVGGFSFGGWEESVMERWRHAEYPVVEVENGSRRKCGPVGFDAEKML